MIDGRENPASSTGGIPTEGYSAGLNTSIIPRPSTSGQLQDFFDAVADVRNRANLLAETHPNHVVLRSARVQLDLLFALMHDSREQGDTSGGAQ